MDTQPTKSDLPARRQLKLSFINGFQAQVGEVQLDFAKEKAAALLVLLMIGAPYRTSRAILRGLLWSDSDEVAAQNSLRNTLWVLRTQLVAQGYDGLSSNRTEAWLDPATFHTDLDECLVSLAAGKAPQKVFPDQGFPKHILSGVTATDLFEHRLETFRNTVHRRISDACHAAVACCAPEQKLGLLQLLSALDPVNEANCRDLIRTLLEAGRKADALAAYQKLWTFLDEEYGEEPAPETQTIIVALKQSQDQNSAPTNGGKPVIVLRQFSVPKNNDTGNADDERLSHLHELTLSVLARFREWRVIDDRFSPDLKGINALSSGIVCVLSLSVAPASAVADRAIAILTDASNGQVLWSEPLSLSPGGRGQDLDLAVKRLAMAMNLHLSGPSRPIAATTAADAGFHYERWIEAQQLMRQFTQKSWQQAQGVLDQILVSSPGFVRALASRASIETMRHITFPGVASTPDIHRRALGWANAAVLADPMDSRAQLSLAWACAMSRQFDRAEVAYELAYQHNENDPWTIASALVGFAFCNRMSRAQSLLLYLTDLKLSLEPIHWSYMAAASFLSGDDQACIEMSERAQICSCDVPAWHAAALAHAGRLDEARIVLSRFRELAAQNWVGARAPKDHAIAGWLLACFPIRARSQWARFRRGLVLAGLQVPGQ